ncbi:DgyrCDS5208 [Dimorphilus gyrociliatus]|uniref:DgyrCDS5208 n=1 Tax=Dimorphilus gyrociliatus TaxID=2664684 RepID=A0A7I8VKT1_9ANNE|nr:DgyrCDS5208 [Dimorphilus gyrociliatus]
MPRPRSASSDASDAGEGMAQEELQRLKRSYRSTEVNKQQYTNESQTLIRKQRQELEQLDKSIQECLKELRLIESTSNKKKDDTNVNSLTDLGNKLTETEKAIVDEIRQQEDLKAEIKEWEAKCKKQNQNMGGSNMSHQHNVKVQRNIGKLENQLDQANSRFSKLLSTNANLRNEIESLRVERTRFDNVYKKLERKLNDLKRETGEVIDISTQAYDQREDAQTKMIQLKEKSDKDIAQHNAEMKELMRIIDHDRKLREFMNVKGADREEDPQQRAWKQNIEKREAQRRKASQTDTVESYEQAMERIKEITQENDIQMLVKKFIEVEDKNFALFNYVNEQNNQIEQLQNEISEIQENIGKYEKEGTEMEEERKDIMRRLENRQRNASKEADVFEEKHKAVMKILDQLKDGIQSLFDKINCDKNALGDMLGAQEGMNEQNIMQYMGPIEQRTNELLKIQGYVLMQKDHDQDFTKKQHSLLGEGPAPPQNLPIIEPPSVGDDLDSDPNEVSDDERRPMTRTELEQKALRSVHKREATMKNQPFRYDLGNNDKGKKKEKGRKY